MNIVVGSNQGVNSGYFSIRSEDNKMELHLINNNYFSCGNKLLVHIERCYHQNPERFEEFLTSILKSKNISTAMYQISVTKSNNGELNKILSKLCTYKTKWIKNPNSSNNIRIYTFVVNK